MRERVFTGIILVLFIAITGGLFYTQIARYGLYSKLSEKNRIRVIPLEAPRGKMYDRNGRLLVSNRIAFDVAVVPNEISNKTKLIDGLSDILGTEKEDMARKISAARAGNPFLPATVAEDIEKDKAIKIEEVRMEFPGVIVTTRPIRNYIYKEAISHVTGYLGKISEAELARYKTYGYRMVDFVGKDGLERAYNDYLRGVDGGIQTEVDSRGRQLRFLAVKEPERGKDLHLTLDAELQKFCSELFKEETGALAVMDSETGGILALVSSPGFDPNIFISPRNSRQVRKLLSDKKYFPMIDRAIASAYPAGSVFKIVVALGGLDSGVFGKDDTFNCSGSHWVGNRVFHCWKDEGHGTLNMRGGLKNSCNIFFYQLGISVGPDAISKYAFKLGLGRPTGIDLPGEVSGFVPTPAWKKKSLRQAWFIGETANLSIGQGYLLVTPLQILQLVNIMATEGKITQPFLVDKIGEVRLHHTKIQDLRLNPEAVEIVREGMRDVVNAPHGTGFYARPKEVIVAGKTGTAQNPNGISHAWFTGFAPFDHPKISVVVFVEHGGKGGLKPARFAKKIVEEAKRLELL
ncbi:MAG: penicillin-binding protein 2 [Candidatus Omnitrophica bacterium]|nr:penicillin-binding protein 2 [Candidatus Omnitrophota bacterium]